MEEVHASVSMPMYQTVVQNKMYMASSHDASLLVYIINGVKIWDHKGSDNITIQIHFHIGIYLGMDTNNSILTHICILQRKDTYMETQILDLYSNIQIHFQTYLLPCTTHRLKSIISDDISIFQSNFFFFPQKATYNLGIASLIANLLLKVCNFVDLLGSAKRDTN